MTDFTDHDLEQLSAYLDGMLDELERATLESQLAENPSLEAELSALRETVMLVRQLPTLSAPRDFTVTREMVGLSPVQKQSTTAPTSKRMITFPTMTLLSAAASFILMVLGAVLILSDSGGGTSAQQLGSVAAYSTQTSLPDEAIEPITMMMDATAFEDTDAGFSAEETLFEAESADQAEEPMILFSAPPIEDDSTLFDESNLADLEMPIGSASGAGGAAETSEQAIEPSSARMMEPVMEMEESIPPAAPQVTQADAPLDAISVDEETLAEAYSQELPLGIEASATVEETFIEDHLPATQSASQPIAYMLLIVGGIFALIAGASVYLQRRIR